MAFSSLLSISSFYPPIYHFFQPNVSSYSDTHISPSSRTHTYIHTYPSRISYTNPRLNSNPQPLKPILKEKQNKVSSRYTYTYIQIIPPHPALNASPYSLLFNPLFISYKPQSDLISNTFYSLYYNYSIQKIAILVHTSLSLSHIYTHTLSLTFIDSHPFIYPALQHL